MKMYGRVGTSEVYHITDGLEYTVPEGAVEIFTPRPHECAVLQPDMSWDCTTAQGIALCRWEDVKALRVQCVAGGVVHNGRAYQTRGIDADNIRSILSAYASGALTGPIQYVTQDNNVVQLNREDFQAIHDIGVRLYLAADARAQELRAALFAAQNPESVDIASGWPTVPYSG